jgi:hypothetical protein
MRKLMILSLALFISGCGTVYKLPDYPEVIGNACVALDSVHTDEEKLSEVMKVVVVNYGKYHECAAKVDAWIKWHKEQSKIIEEMDNDINKRTTGTNIIK